MNRRLLFWDPQLANNSITAQVAANPFTADLALGMNGPKDLATIGDLVTFTIMLTNNGPDEAKSVTITDSVPAGVTPVSGDLVMTLPSLAAGVSQTFTIIASVDDGLTDPTTVANTATVTSLAYDSDLTNNTASATAALNAPAPPPADSAQTR